MGYTISFYINAILVAFLGNLWLGKWTFMVFIQLIYLLSFRSNYF